ncbi:hypothetical protein J1N35_010834, partial [Gossypium stocksii]
HLMSKGGSSKVVAKVSAVIEHIAFTPTFKRHTVSVIRDFLPGCGRVTTTNFGS